MDILKQLIAFVKTKIRNIFKVLSTEKLCMAVFINCKWRVFYSEVLKILVFYVN